MTNMFTVFNCNLLEIGLSIIMTTSLIIITNHYILNFAEYKMIFRIITRSLSYSWASCLKSSTCFTICVIYEVYQKCNVAKSTHYIPFMQIFGSSKFSIPECKCTGNALTPQSVATPQLVDELLIIASSFAADANTRPTVLTHHHHYSVIYPHFTTL